MQHPRPRPGARGNDSGTSLGSDAAFFTPASRKLQVRPARDRFARAMVFEAFGYQHARALDYDGFIDREPNQAPLWWRAAS